MLLESDFSTKIFQILTNQIIDGKVNGVNGKVKIYFFILGVGQGLKYILYLSTGKHLFARTVDVQSHLTTSATAHNMRSRAHLGPLP